MGKAKGGAGASGSSDDLSDEVLGEPTDKKPSKAKSGGKDVKKTAKPGIGSKTVRFVRETVGELRKVIWPTRKDLVTYTIVTIVFVTLLVSFVWGLDYGLAKAVLHLFGDPNAENPGVSPE